MPSKRANVTPSRTARTEASGKTTEWPGHSSKTSNDSKHEAEFSQLLLHGLRLKVRIKASRDLRVAYLHRSELKATEVKIRTLAQRAGWSNAHLNRLISQVSKEHHRKVAQLEAEQRFKASRRRPPPPPRDRRPPTPVSPLANTPAPHVSVRQLTFEQTPKRLDVVPRRRAVFFVPSLSILRLAAVVGVCAFAMSLCFLANAAEKLPV